MKTIKFITLGCKVNQYDTQVIREQFLGRGFKEIDAHQSADIYVVNTCTVTHKADRDSLYYINRSHRENPAAKIIVTGCLAELDSQIISKKPNVSLIAKNKDKYNLANSLNGLNELNGHHTEHNGISYFKGHTRAFLKIEDGCDNFCAYCKVPLVRGAPQSKPLDEVIQEAKQLIKNGFKELVLSGICLGKYGKDLDPKINLLKVINALEDIPGLSRLRLSSIEALDVSDGLIEKMAHSKKLCRHLHIPVQSGDDRILERMNRAYRRKDYLNLIQKIKRRIPRIAITTDCLVGFPGEEESNFGNTLDLIEKISPLKVHIFPYSRRKGTQAYNFKDNLSQDKLALRLARLGKTADKCALAYRRQFIGKNMDVLIEGYSKAMSGYWEGHTDNYIKVIVKSDAGLTNQIIPLKLKEIEQDAVVASFESAFLDKPPLLCYTF